MKIKCGCIDRKILKSERQDYPEGTERIIDFFCDKHQREFDEDGEETLIRDLLTPDYKEAKN